MERPFQAYDGDEPYVFVCYAHDDKVLVYPEITRLKDAGFNIWYDEGITPGSEWRSGIAKAIDECARFVYFVTPDAVGAMHCRRELHYAESKRKPIVSVFLKPTELPGELELQLGLTQAIYQYDLPSDDYRRKLASALPEWDGPEEDVGTVPTRVAEPSKPRFWWSAALVVLLVTGSAGAWWWQSQRSEPPTPAADNVTIAVLPLRDLSAREELSWLAAGLTHELRHHIGEIVGYSSVPTALLRDRRPDDLPDDVDLALDGYLQNSGDDVKAVVELIDLHTRQKLWAESFAGRDADPMDLQVQIVSRILRYFNVTMQSPSTGPTAPAARTAYFKWLRFGWTGNARQVTFWLERTLELDPSWAEGYVLRYFDLAADGTDESVQQAREALSTARELGMESEPLFVVATAIAAWTFDGDFDRAEGLLASLAVERHIYAPYADLMLVSGLVAEAEEYYESATAIAPYNDAAWSNLAAARARLGDIDGALEAATEVENLAPADSINLFQVPMLWLLPNSGRLTDARRYLARLESMAADSPAYRGMSELLAFEIAMQTNDRERALEAATWLAQTPAHQHAGLMYLRLGDPRAQEMLELAAERPHVRRPTAQWFLIRVPQGLRKHPWLRGMLDRWGLTDEWRLELCKRAATFPEGAPIKCDPSKYALDVAGT